MKIYSNIVIFLILALSLNANAGNDGKKADITYEYVSLKCQENCNLNQLIAQYIKKSTSTFEHQFFIFKFIDKDGNELYQKSLVQYINDKYKKKISSYSKFIQPKTSDMRQGDGSLDCEVDPDFTCQDWLNVPITNDYVEYIHDVIESSKFEIVITQDYINNTNNFINTLVSTALSSIPSTVIIRFANLTGQTVGAIYAAMGEAYLSFFQNYLLGKINWTGLEAGDVFIITGGDQIKIKTPSSNTGGGQGSEPGSGNSGGGGGGGSESFILYYMVCYSGSISGFKNNEAENINYDAKNVSSVINIPSGSTCVYRMW